MTKTRWPSFFNREYFLLLTPLFFILHGLARYPEAIAWIDALKLLLLYIAASVLLAVLFKLLFHSIRKSALFAFLLLVFHFGFGAGHDLLKQFFSGTIISSYAFLLPLSVLFFITLFALLRRSHRSFSKLTLYLNCLLTLLIAYELLQLSIKTAALNSVQMEGLEACASCPKPDIYLMVVDGYGGQEQLVKGFKFDNSDFKKALERRGFHWIDSSISNYAASNRSMASLFNMKYLSKQTDDFHEGLNRNVFTEYLKGLQYNVRNHSIFKVAGQFPPQELAHFPIGTKLITGHTFLGRLQHDLRHNLATVLRLPSELERLDQIREAVETQNRSRDSATLQQVLHQKKQVQKGQARFIYGHFLMPHPPYVFDKDGGEANPALTKREQYIDYLQYTNKTMLAAIDKLLEGPGTPPVIMLISDHGYRFDEGETLTPDRFLNMKALYLPDGNYARYRRGLSNVNFLRVFLNQQFRQQLPLLPDSTVF